MDSGQRRCADEVDKTGVKDEMSSDGFESSSPARGKEGIDDVPLTVISASNSGSHDDNSVDVEAAGGAAAVEGIQAVWGKYGKWILIAGLGLMMTMYELDNSTISVYQNFATSYFDKLSLIASLNTAGTIIFAVVKPPFAKISDACGRAETYLITVSILILSYILSASAAGINAFAAGSVIYSMGKSGLNVMNTFIISDITSARSRGFALGISFFPFLFMPWISASITSSVIDGIGWRWGIGMLAILIPFSAAFIIITLLYFQRKAKKMGFITIRRPQNPKQFCSAIDLGGVILLSGGFAMLLLPLTLASSTPSSWQTPYLIALLILGGFFIIALPFYEKYVAKNPVVPVHYFKNLTIVMAILLIAFDALGFSCTHSYLIAWSTIARNFDVRTASYYYYTNGVTQCLVGILAGWYMQRTRRYKWLCVLAVCIRFVGYGLMIRLRGANNSIAELFIVQLIQGVGSGIIEVVVVVAPQIVVPHSQMAQVTSLVICCSFLGGSIGSAIAGGIYTNTFKGELNKQLGLNATPELVDGLYNSISFGTPAWGTPDRTAINLAYSNVLRNMTYAAIASCVPSLAFTCFLPNLELPEKNNLVEEEKRGPEAV